jgi:hypothetical protein
MNFNTDDFDQMAFKEAVRTYKTIKLTDARMNASSLSDFESNHPICLVKRGVCPEDASEYFNLCKRSSSLHMCFTCCFANCNCGCCVYYGCCFAACADPRYPGTYSCIGKYETHILHPNSNSNFHSTPCSN